MPAPTNRRPRDIVRSEDINDVARVANSAEARVGAVETQVNGRLSDTTLTSTFATQAQLSEVATGDPIAVTDVSMAAVVGDPASAFRTAGDGVYETQASAGEKFARVYNASPTFADGPDATAHLQALLNAAAATGGGTVMLPARRFVVSEMLTIPQDVNLVGSGRDSIIDASSVLMLTPVYAERTTGTKVRNLTVRGSGQGSQPTNDKDAPNVRDSGSGIVFAGVTDGLIEGCYIEDCGGTTGVAPYNGVAGVWITYGCINTKVRNNVVTRCRNGINEDNFFQADPHDNEISGNKVTDSRFGIALDSSSLATNTVVSYNTVAGCQQSGIDLHKANRVRVIGNYVTSCGLENGNAGIFLYGTASIPAFDVVLSGNQVFSCTGHGIKVGPHVYNVTLDANTVAKNAKNGIFMQGPVRNFTLRGNVARENTENGIRLFSTTATELLSTGTLSGNIASANTQNGFLLQGAVETALHGNIAKGNSFVAGNTYDGFRLEAATVQCTLTGNVSSGSGQRYALALIDAGSEFNTFEGNTLLPGTTGRFGMANDRQHWGNNADRLVTSAGAPTGVYPSGAIVANRGDQKLYVKQATGWVAYSGVTA